MKSKMKWVASAVNLVLCTSLLAACSSGSSGGSDSSSKLAETKLVNGKFDPPVKLTVWKNAYDSKPDARGKTIQNNPFIQFMVDKVGVESVYPEIITGDASTKLKLKLASGEKLPDIISLRDDKLTQELISSGQFMEVGPLFDKYAGDVWKKAMNEDTTVWDSFVIDGKRMALPQLDYKYNADPVLWIREDWRKKLKLPEPKTLADFEVLLDAFTNKDPDGNGKKDTYGYAAGLKDPLNTWMSDSGWIFGEFGTLPNQWNKAADGSLEYGSINPAMKQGLAKLKEWLDKGYIDQESGIMDGIKATDAVTAGKTGMFAGPQYSAGWPIGGLFTNVKGAEIKAYPIPVGPDGKRMFHASSFRNGVILINKDCKNPEAYFVYQNWLYDNYANAAVGSPYEYGFQENLDWATIKGKKYVFDDAKNLKPDLKLEKMNAIQYDVARIPSKMIEDYQLILQGKKSNIYGVRQESIATAPVLLSQKDSAVNSMFTGAPTQTMVDRQDFLDKMERETFSKILYGKLPLDAFDDFVKQWKSGGGDKITEEVNAWYKELHPNN
ncbi:putative aldouronate transport system substrate-binding protein [Paenibacillus rhizosphaerae]|uniref:Putative aldouronate transport system substrate-binding protein n=1 Tax=Paenibacillus rhizosphaerae TaxID=297318 RepID=A0A839TK63_9BACL|nr:extracellular solute-binding protein [Paenibacillus rhizosphaerae]MBB3127032.1 putative aldouronate transport system substrate-binding protein [Paenibacillus rhizosphaerae]